VLGCGGEHTVSTLKQRLQYIFLIRNNPRRSSSLSLLRPSKMVEKGSIFLPSIWASPLGAHFDFGPHSLLGCMAT
jgi:hypothetical protein